MATSFYNLILYVDNIHGKFLAAEMLSLANKLTANAN